MTSDTRSHLSLVITSEESGQCNLTLPCISSHLLALLLLFWLKIAVLLSLKVLPVDWAQLGDSSDSHDVLWD